MFHARKGRLSSALARRLRVVLIQKWVLSGWCVLCDAPHGECMSSQGVLDAEERCSQTGDGSRFNAVTHGLTAKTAVFPWECHEAFQARIDVYKNGLETRTPLEDELAERAALASWQLDRASRSEVARVTRDILTKSAADALREAKEAVALGDRLFFDRRGPIELYPSGQYEKRQLRTSSSGNAVDPENPANLVLDLEGTLGGCRWLLSAWNSLRDVLEAGLGWQSHQKIKAIRLLGKQPISALDDRKVAMVFLAAHAVGPEYSYAFQELRSEIHEDQFKRFKSRLDRWSQRGIAPADATEGRAMLLSIVDEATARLRVLESQHQKLAEELGGLQSDLLSFDESKTGEQVRRHMGSCNRLPASKRRCRPQGPPRRSARVGQDKKGERTEEKSAAV